MYQQLHMVGSDFCVHQLSVLCLYLLQELQLLLTLSPLWHAEVAGPICTQDRVKLLQVLHLFFNVPLHSLQLSLHSLIVRLQPCCKRLSVCLAVCSVSRSHMSGRASAV
ncbi:hypothetical protein ABBQ38_012016 [Trebouxia sp. C0009 RCD-2024]